MRIPILPSPLFLLRRRLALVGSLLAVGILPWAGVTTAWAEPAPEDFGSLVRLAPFVVNGQQLSISIHARTRGDRHYAAGFAEEVVKVVYEAVTPETGRGLVIIGRKGEPHPILVFRKFLAMAQAGQLDPAVAAHASELTAELDRWQSTVTAGESSGSTDDDLEFEKIITALPLTLEGVGAQLYQLAWAEKFDDAKVTTRLQALRASDLDGTLFKPYDWVFYLPPKKAFDQVLDELVSDALKKEDDAGVFARMAVKGVMLVVKPRIRRAIEAVRQGLLFSTVVQARTKFGPDDVSELTDAYIETLLPDDDDDERPSGSEHERAVKAVHNRLQELQKDAAAASSAAIPEN